MNKRNTWHFELRAELPESVSGNGQSLPWDEVYKFGPQPLYDVRSKKTALDCALVLQLTHDREYAELIKDVERREACFEDIMVELRPHRPEYNLYRINEDREKRLTDLNWTRKRPPRYWLKH